jgi:hypothetical protein
VADLTAAASQNLDLVHVARCTCRRACDGSPHMLYIWCIAA